MSGYFGEQYNQVQQHQQYQEHYQQDQYQQDQYQQDQYQHDQYQQEPYQQAGGYDVEQLLFQQQEQLLRQRQFDLQDQMQELQRQQQSLTAANFSQQGPHALYQQQHQQQQQQHQQQHQQQQFSPSGYSNHQQQQQLHYGSSSSSPSIPDETSNLYKTELCRGFMQTGACRYGDKCQFAHGMQELRSTVKHPLYKTTRCKSYQATGRCRYGNRCRFIHGESELELAILPRGVPAQNLNIVNDTGRGPSLVPVGSNLSSPFQGSVGQASHQASQPHAHERQHRGGSLVTQNDIQFSNLHYQLSTGSPLDTHPKQQQNQGGIMRHLSSPELSGDIRRVPSAPAGLDRHPSQSSSPYSNAYDMSGMHRALSGSVRGGDSSNEHSLAGSGLVGASSLGHGGAARLIGCSNSSNNVDGHSLEHGKAKERNGRDNLLGGASSLSFAHSGNGSIGASSFEQRSSSSSRTNARSSRQAAAATSTSPSSSLEHSLLRSRQFHSIDHLDRSDNNHEGQQQQQQQHQQQQHQHGIQSIHTSRSSAGVESLLSHPTRSSGLSPSHMPVPVPPASTSPFSTEGGRERQHEGTSGSASASLGRIGSHMYSSGSTPAVTSNTRSGQFGMSVSSVDVAHRNHVPDEYINNDNDHYAHSSQDVSREYVRSSSSSSSSSSSPNRRVVQSVPFAMDRMISLEEDNDIKRQTGLFINSTGTTGVSAALSGSLSGSSVGGAGVVFEMGDGDGSSSDEDEDEQSSANLAQFSPESTQTRSFPASPESMHRDLGLPPLDVGALPFSLPSASESYFSTDSNNNMHSRVAPGVNGSINGSIEGSGDGGDVSSNASGGGVENAQGRVGRASSTTSALSEIAARVAGSTYAATTDQ